MNFNPRMRFVWLAQAFLVILLLFLWALIMYIIFPFDTDLIDGIPSRALIGGIVVGVAVMLLVAVALGAELYYRNFEYEFADDAFVVRKGIFSRKEFIIPYKDIDAAKVLRSGIHSLDQVFGLTCVKVSAGSKFVIIPGITEPEVFLRRLMAHVEGNEHIKNSEIYLSEREILLKVSADIRNLHSKLEQFIIEQKTMQATQKPSREHQVEFLRNVEKDQLIDLKALSDVTERKDEREKNGKK